MRAHGTWMGFLAMAFAVVGLAGLSAAFALPIPLERAVARIAALDAAGPADARIVAVLGAAAAAPILRGAGTDADHLQAATRSILREAAADQHATAVRLRWLIVIATAMAAAFGVAILGAAARRNGGPEGPAGGSFTDP